MIHENLSSLFPKMVIVHNTYAVLHNNLNLFVDKKPRWKKLEVIVYPLTRLQYQPDFPMKYRPDLWGKINDFKSIR